MGKILSSLTGIRDIGAAVKSKVRANLTEGKLVRTLNDKIAGGYTITGRNNYNKQAKVLGGMVKSHKMSEARGYMKSQNAKAMKQGYKGY